MDCHHMIHHPKYREVWSKSLSNELGCLTQGSSRVQLTNTMFFLPYKTIPVNRQKNVTYGRTMVDYRPQHTRITVGGNLVNYPKIVSSKTVELTNAKILINRTIFTPNAKFCVLDTGNFYLGTPMQQYEYMFIDMKDIPDDIVTQYYLKKCK